MRSNLLDEYIMNIVDRGVMDIARFKRDIALLKTDIYRYRYMYIIHIHIYK